MNDVQSLKRMVFATQLTVVAICISVVFSEFLLASLFLLLVSLVWSLAELLG